MKRRIVPILMFVVFVGALAVAQEEPRQPTAAKEDSPYALEVETGAGFDSNSFKAPQEPYTDPGAGAIAPVSKPGFHVPVALDTAYALEKGKWSFVPALKFRSDLYALADTRDATRYYVKVEPALELLMARRGRFKNTLFVEPFVVFKRSTYVDHDTGTEVANQGQLYTYLGFGGDARLRFRT